MKRRKFIETSGRWFSLISLITLGGYLLMNREVISSASCQEFSFCGQCGKRKGCQKSAALDYRRKYSIDELNQ